MLWHAPEPAPRLVAVLGAIALDPGLDAGQRRDALTALRDVPGPEVTRVLLRAAASDEVAVQVAAAWGLTLAGRLPEHRDLVGRPAAGRPADAAHPASELREALADPDDD